MLSICIPVYNFDVTSLVNRLAVQIKDLDVKCKIILIDDCSSDEFNKINAPFCSQHTYIQLDKNIGRSKIRNLFLTYSESKYLLFLDCDSFIFDDGFLSKYIHYLKTKNWDVICGGRVYGTDKPERSKILRWKYGVNKESQPYEVRRQSPNKSFMTNNFLIKREILQSFRFDENIHDYGHEDTLFGYLLKKNKIQIKHIDNPILNGDIEENAIFLLKTEKGIANLIYILDYLEYDNAFIQDVALLRFYYRIKSYHLTNLLYYKFVIIKPLLKSLFIKGYVSLLLFDFYKLGILISNFKCKTKNNKV
ncbi:MAG: glycosyltransferase [Bacteroidetes bacterium]|nr:glycosyltransferase [Bacteroidota bacterium]